MEAEKITRAVAQRVYRAMSAIRKQRITKWANGERVAVEYGYYMMNVGHPWIDDAYGRWLHARGINPRWGKTDEVRTQFELSMLSDEALKMLGDFMREKERGGVGPAPSVFRYAEATSLGEGGKEEVLK